MVSGAGRAARVRLERSSALRRPAPLLWVALVLLGSAACGGIAAPEERAEQAALLGSVTTLRYRLEAAEGLLHVRDSSDEGVVARALAPDFSFTVTRTDPTLDALVVKLWNLPQGLRLVAAPGVLSESGAPVEGRLELAFALGASWRLRFPPGVDTLEVRTEASPPSDFTFLAFADVQTGIDRFDDVVAALNSNPDADFVVMMGDLTQRSSEGEFDVFEEKVRALQRPLYATPGNHDVFLNTAYAARYGRGSYSFVHRGVRFTSVDSASAVLAPQTWSLLEGWLGAGLKQPHVVFSHIPSTEFFPLRSAQWDSRREAHRFVASALEGKVDLLLFGHVHTYDAYELGGIPTFISGGGGASPELLDNVGRHYLRVALVRGAPQVTLIRID